MRERRWIRKWRLDAETDGLSPLPTRVVSNEEYVPLSQTPEQARVAALLQETARTNARRLSVSRRDFLSSSAGMAAAFLAISALCWDVNREARAMPPLLAPRRPRATA